MPDSADYDRSPAYAYGQTLGRIQLGMERMFADIAAGMRDAAKARTRPPTEADRENIRVALYRQRIERERALGRAYVKRLTRDFEKHLFSSDGSTP